MSQAGLCLKTKFLWREFELGENEAFLRLESGAAVGEQAEFWTAP